MNRQSYLDHITLLSVVYTDVEPMKPVDADFGLTIDFEKGKSDPVKVFESMVKMLNSFRQIDQILTGAVAPEATPIMVLEDIEAASITSWIKTTLNRIDDQAIKEFDPKQVVGALLVKAKHAVIIYLDKRIENEKRESLESLADNLTKLGLDIPRTTVLLPSAIQAKDLVAPLNQIQEAKAILGPNERMLIQLPEGKMEVNTKATEPVNVVVVPESSKVLDGELPMILLVKKPDYLGNSKWEFKHDKTSISAAIADAAWLTSFRSGQVLLQPGSQMMCRVYFKHAYNERGQITETIHEVREVTGTMSPSHTDITDLFSP